MTRWVLSGAALILVGTAVGFGQGAGKEKKAPSLDEQIQDALEQLNRAPTRPKETFKFELPKDPGDNPALAYPADALSRGQEGTVMLRLRITPEGTVANVYVEKSSGVRSLDDEAARGMRRWKFHPATEDGVPVQAEVLKPVQFLIRR